MGEEPGNSTRQQVHMSADDLNDGFVLDSDDKKTLAYQVRRRRQTLLGSRSVHTRERDVSLDAGWKMEHWRRSGGVTR